MSRNFFSKIASILSRWRRRTRPYDNFTDGSSLTEIHRYAIQYRSPEGKVVDIGFDADVSRSYVWIIHEATLTHWKSPAGEVIQAEEKDHIIRRVIEYCQARNLRYVVEP